ncbi:MAG: hypothetical protein IJV22_04690 [Bacteroidales bacterium]|nr:hypothetical protein [Bacteroidales bacterium]
MRNKAICFGETKDPIGTILAEAQRCSYDTSKCNSTLALGLRENNPARKMQME